MTVPPMQPPQYPRRLRVFIVRHGETHENVAGIIQGQLDTPLNPFGRLQAAATANYLSSICFDRIITSPLQRARDTAQAILAQQPEASDLKLEQDERIKERCFGVIEGKAYTGVGKGRDQLEGVEQIPDLIKRLAGFWKELITVHDPPIFGDRISSEQQPQQLDNREEHVIALVSHGAAISALLNAFLLTESQVHLPSNIQISRYANCCITELIVPTIIDRRAPYLSLEPPAPPQSKEESAVIFQQMQQPEESLESDGSMDYLGADVNRGSESQVILQDLGFGEGVGYAVRWAETTHLQDLVKEGPTSKVNVDELVGK
jgi:broad specificity phosphatase PhoE